MNKINLKFILVLNLVIFLLLLIFVSSFLKFEKKQINEEISKELLQKEIAKKAKEEIEEKKYLTGKFDPSTKENFALIPIEYTTNKDQMYLRKEALDAFLKMRDAALSEQIDFKIVSATRNFESQKYIWNNKWTGITKVNGEDLSVSIPDSLERFKKILEYSAAPGTSRHHFGTDIDINNTNPEYFNSKLGSKTYQWLVKNANLYGFCQPYNLKGNERPTGYNEEKWHWSYSPLAKIFTQKYVNLIKNEDINGFLGDENVIGQNLIFNYILGINPDCL